MRYLPAAMMTACFALQQLFLPDRIIAAEPHVPTFAWICSQMVQMGAAQQGWCDDEASLYNRIGVTDSQGRVRSDSQICNDTIRGKWIQAIWAAKSSDLGFALFSSGAFSRQADQCFNLLSGANSRHSAWRWRAAEGVLESYVVSWETDYGESADQVAGDLSKARQYLAESLQHSDFLPSSDLQMVRERLSAIGGT